MKKGLRRLAILMAVFYIAGCGKGVLSLPPATPIKATVAFHSPPPAASITSTPTASIATKTPTKEPNTTPEEAAPISLLQPTITEEPFLKVTAPIITLTRSLDGGVMVYVPGGTFQMGSSEDEIAYALLLCEQYRGAGMCRRSWFEDESPQHQVTLDSFWIDRTEVTNHQYETCVAAGGCQPADCFNEFPIDESHKPVGCVTWFNATSYCAWAGMRLPTEAEWEYAARGPSGAIFPWGDAFDPSRLNYCDFNCTYKWHDTSYDDGYSWPAPVGNYPQGISWSGAQDMAGNAWEWVSDWYDSGYYGVSPAANPQGPEDGDLRGFRGGSAHFFPAYQRSARRGGVHPTQIYASGGFRCAVGADRTPP